MGAQVVLHQRLIGAQVRTATAAVMWGHCLCAAAGQESLLQVCCGALLPLRCRACDDVSSCQFPTKNQRAENSGSFGKVCLGL